MKSPDLLYLQNCLFMSQIETNQRLANSFVDLRHCGDNHTYLTKSKAKGLLDIPFVNTQIYGTQSVKYNCITDRNNFRNNFSDIPWYQIYQFFRYTDIQMYLYTCQKTRKILSDWQILKVSFDSREIDLYDIP